MATLADRRFSLFGGGPFHGAIRKLHLVDAAGKPRIATIVAVAWLPIALGGALRYLRGLPLDPLVTDLSVHARFLVALPLLLLSTQLLERQCGGAVATAYAAQLAEPRALDGILERAEKMRDSGWVELALALGALTIGQLGQWGIGAGPTGLFHGIERHPDWSVMRVSVGTVSFPLWQFLSARWLWRWIIWTYVLVRVSRAPLAATAAHPDHAAGLGCFAWPLAGYLWYVGAFASVFAGASATQMIDHEITVAAVAPVAAILIVAAILVGYAPLLAFTPKLYAAKRSDLAKYTLLGFEYMRDFNAKWLGASREEKLLGTPDIQSLNDIGAAFQMVLTTRLTVFAPARLKMVVVAVVLPMLPLLATMIPLKSVMPRLASVMLGGL